MNTIEYIEYIFFFYKKIRIFINTITGIELLFSTKYSSLIYIYIYI